jgi:signal transduction histidine kinase
MLTVVVVGAKIFPQSGIHGSSLGRCARAALSSKGNSLAGESARYSGHPLSEAGGQRERFAALIRAERGAILASCAESLEAIGDSVTAEPRDHNLAMAIGAETIADIAARVQGSEDMIDERRTMLAWMADGERAESPSSLADLLRATATFFDITVSTLASHVGDDPGLLPCFVTAIHALNESISRRIGDAILAHTGYLLERVEQARIEERRRIARDLHDRLGEGLSGALRQLELHEITVTGNPLTPSPRLARAKDALTEAMGRLRVVTSDLRQEPVRNLEQALIQYVDSADTNGTEVRLRVSGDETWTPPSVIDEAFLIIREAVRNALRHGAPHEVLIGVALAPHELYGWIVDDGRGFASAGSTGPVRSGNGIAAMRERAALMGGQLTITSAPGHGTRVELFVPLAGPRDEQR